MGKLENRGYGARFTVGLAMYVFTNVGERIVRMRNYVTQHFHEENDVFFEEKSVISSNFPL